MDTMVPVMSVFSGRSRFGFFHTQRIQSTTLGPEIMV